MMVICNVCCWFCVEVCWCCVDNKKCGVGVVFFVGFVWLGLVGFGYCFFGDSFFGWCFGNGFFGDWCSCVYGYFVYCV